MHAPPGGVETGPARRGLGRTETPDSDERIRTVRAMRAIQTMEAKAVMTDPPVMCGDDRPAQMPLPEA